MRLVTPGEALAYALRMIGEVVPQYVGVPDLANREEMILSTLACQPELHARGVHAERTANGDLQLAAFATLAELQQFWAPGLTEAVLRDTAGVNILTLTIDGVPTKCAEPFLKEPAS
jgi:hypothetical protein